MPTLADLATASAHDVFAIVEAIQCNANSPTDIRADADRRLQAFYDAALTTTRPLWLGWRALPWRRYSTSSRTTIAA